MHISVVKRAEVQQVMDVSHPSVLAPSRAGSIPVRLLDATGQAGLNKASHALTGGLAPHADRHRLAVG